METLWLMITNLGRDEVFIVVLALFTWLVRPQGGRELGVAFALSYLLNSALKYGLNLPRPFTNDPSLASEAARATAGGPGLPSGHAQMSATLWLGIAAQLRSTGFTVFAALLVALICASRLLLHVHYPSDIAVGLLLGAVFALLAARVHFPQAGLLRWGVPAALLLAAAFIPAGAPREFGTGLGLLAGFWAARPTFSPPRDWAGRLIVAALGLIMVFAVYFALAALPHELKDLGVVRTLRYALLVLVAAEGVPLALRRWLPAQPVTPQGAAQAVH
ncbi:phosphatase PAP2 family protein [Deinococcus radiotolerans]|uniref:Phosphatase PAP2 family protein n=1 Tax=Deinococcus radiotolerans TaxID=1309407 RepID=A0ABQ2FFQ7_9DEIO|nr:phosphatase PAP2 family protein [Deinococcus radiotolerans]GGK93967.1 phosphatase PAP2 family protein [Deinococcus radiotolerans]